MDLQTFIKETLCQISNGMIEAQEALKEKGVTINPKHSKDTLGCRPVEDNIQESLTQLQIINFDIALTATDTTKTGGGVTIAVVVATLKGQASKEALNSSLSRVQFEVVARLPRYKAECI